MKLPAIISRLFTKGAVTPLGFGQGWFTVIRESFAGAFQANITVDPPRDVLAFSAVFACTTKIAGDIAKLRPMLVMDNDDGTCTEVKAQSPFRAVLEKPNHYQTRITFIKQWVICKLVYGNAYALKERDNRGVVTRLYLLDPQRVKPLVTDDGAVYYELSADPLSGLPQTVTVPASEIIHDLMYPLWHPLVGVSPLYACGLSATMGNRIQKNSTGFFANSSRPGGALVAPGKLSAEDAQELKLQWEANYGGSNSGRTAVLGNGLKYEPMSIPAQEAQLIDQLKWTVEDVARCYGMPLYKIGGPIPPNTTVEALNQTYYDDCLHILIEDFELCMKEGLSLPSGVYVEMDLDGLLRMDQSAMAEMAKALVGAGIETPNEARKRFNLPPVDGGDACYLQQQNYSTEALAKRDALPDPFAKTGSTPTPAPANAESYAAAMGERIEKTVNEAIAKALGKPEVDEAEELARLFIEGLNAAAA